MTGLVEFLQEREREIRFRADSLHGLAASLPPVPTKWVAEIADWMVAEANAIQQIVWAYELRLQQGQHQHGDVFGYHATGILHAMKHLAAAHAGHPDYDQVWRP